MVRIFRAQCNAPLRARSHLYTNSYEMMCIYDINHIYIYKLRIKNKVKVIFVVVKSSALHAIFSLHHVVRKKVLLCRQLFYWTLLEATNPKMTACLTKASGIWITFIQLHYPLETLDFFHTMKYFGNIVEKGWKIKFP